MAVMWWPMKRNLEHGKQLLKKNEEELNGDGTKVCKLIGLWRKVEKENSSSWKNATIKDAHT